MQTKICYSVFNALTWLYRQPGRARSTCDKSFNLTLCLRGVFSQNSHNLFKLILPAELSPSPPLSLLMKIVMPLLLPPTQVYMQLIAHVPSRTPCVLKKQRTKRTSSNPRIRPSLEG